MICTSLISENHDELFVRMREAERLADLVEVRLDHLREPPDLAAILRRSSKPVIFTCRPKREGGEFEGEEKRRLALLQEAVDLGAEYVDVERDCIGKVRRKSRTRLTVSYHNFEETPADIEDIHAQMSGLGGDIVKVACMARDATDNARMFRLLLKKDRLPTIALCMGEFGIASRVLAKRFGGFLTFASVDEKSAAAPGQIPAPVLRSLYRYQDQNRDTRLFCVIGDPIAHSMSPAIHNAAFQSLDMNAVYTLFRVLDPVAFVREFIPLGFEGISVTIPHKEHVMTELDEIDPVAKKIGAVNTICVCDGKRYGRNTDWMAAVRSIEKAVRRRLGRDALKGLSAVMIGAGGAARAIAFGLVEAGVSVGIFNRTVERAKTLAEDVAKVEGLETVPWNASDELRQNGRIIYGGLPLDGALRDVCDILVNASSIGMHPRIEASPVDKTFFRSDMVVFDAVYNPLRTKFLREAEAVGCEIVMGLEMFVGQAVEQFELWTGRTAPADVMAAVVKDRLRERAEQ